MFLSVSIPFPFFFSVSFFLLSFLYFSPLCYLVNFKHLLYFFLNFFLRPTSMLSFFLSLIPSLCLFLAPSLDFYSPLYLSAGMLTCLRFFLLSFFFSHSFLPSYPVLSIFPISCTLYLLAPLKYVFDFFSFLFQLSVFYVLTFYCVLLLKTDFFLFFLSFIFLSFYTSLLSYLAVIHLSYFMVIFLTDFFLIDLSLSLLFIIVLYFLISSSFSNLSFCLSHIPFFFILLFSTD